MFDQASKHPSQGLDIELAGMRVRLLPQRAMFLPESRTLLIADAHFGKSSSFRAEGIPIPAGTTTENLARLEGLVLACQPSHLVFLGDFLHAEMGRHTGLWARLEAWRKRHPQMMCTLVRGNHDQHAGDPPPEVGIVCVDEPLAVGPFLLCHMPVAQAGGYVLAGHLHPAVRVSGRIDSVRLPCFWFGDEVGVLPAFGAFTGMYTIEPAATDRVVAVVEEALVVLGAQVWEPRRGRVQRGA